MTTKAKKPKRKPVLTGEVGVLPTLPEPWPSAFCGEPIPSLRVPYPPRLYSSTYASPDFYETAHGEYFLGFWGDGAITLCQHDNESDLCRTAEGLVYAPGGCYGGPPWIMPLELVPTPKAE